MTKIQAHQKESVHGFTYRIKIQATLKCRGES